MKMSNTYVKYNNNKNKNDLFEQRRILNKDVENATKSSKLMKGIGIWTSWYRFFFYLFVLLSAILVVLNLFIVKKKD